MYLGDISGAFDRVFKDYLLAKLYSAGVSDLFLDFLNSYLSPRVGKVAVEGALSDAFTLSDMCFQGTVLGPALWNVFFGDVALPASLEGGQPSMFADDISISQDFPTSMLNAQVRQKMVVSRNHVHSWGHRNRVTFDSGKEAVVILHPAHGEGPDFKFLGCIFDVKLTMQSAIDNIVPTARAKMRALLRT